MITDESIVQLPPKLRQAVEEYLKSHEGARFLTTKSLTSHPYKDKSIVLYMHNAYLEWGNLMTVLSWTEHSSGSYDLGITESYMNVGDMKVFMNESEWFKP